MTQNQQSRAETNQIDPRKIDKMTRSDPKFSNWGNLEFSTSFCLSNF